MNWANITTIGRILIVPAVIISLINYLNGDEIYRILALILFSIGGISDALDGLLAKYLNQESELGKFLDPVADKLLLISTFVMLVIVKLLPIWVVIIIISRDIIILFGCAIIYLISGMVEIKPRILSKLTTVIQIVTIIIILIKNPFAKYFWFATALITSISALDYLAYGSRKLSEVNNKPHS